ncbi:hypothetical protein [Bradyrhizobium algeriense]|uniref:hypothetical protein n=1 Tax=Bradyrhizobium algeriense TaxID=634784 RepID=UPI000D358697|nr:hypothetical protein [Bradyrhizobium algeriense]
MAADKDDKQGGPKITGLDIFKNVGAALLIAFLVYWLPVLAEQFYSPAEIRYRHVTLGNNSGYLFSIQNYSRRPIDELSIYIDAPKGLGSVLYDGAISIETSTSTHPSMVKLKTIAPHSEATLFVTTDAPFESNRVRASSSSTITLLEDTKIVARQLWSPSTFFNSAFTALLYLTFALTMTAQRKQLRSELETLHNEANRIKETADKGIENLNWRMMRTRVYMQRRIIRLEEEVEVWRRFFRSIYSSVFGHKSDAEPAIELILKLSGVPMVKRLREYSEAEFIKILEESERVRDDKKQA